jgi:hypothetical protein
MDALNLTASIITIALVLKYITAITGAQKDFKELKVGLCDYSKVVPQLIVVRTMSIIMKSLWSNYTSKHHPHNSADWISNSGGLTNKYNV